MNERPNTQRFLVELRAKAASWNDIASFPDYDGGYASGLADALELAEELLAPSGEGTCR